MGIPFEKLAPPAMVGPTPARQPRDPLVWSQDCVIDPPVVLAPMAAITNPPFRLLCREMGAGLVVTEMIYARGLLHKEPRAMKMLDLRPQEKPVSVQIYGREPDELARAAAMIEEAGAHAVDLNMGCPMRKVVSSGHGAALLRDPLLVEEIFRQMKAAVSIPVTGKIRAGFEDASAIDVARAMENGGASAVTIHGRTRCEKYEGHADLFAIRKLKESVGISVIGNGDISDWRSARRMFDATGCDAVMVARGCLGNPWVFRQIKADMLGLAFEETVGVEEIRHVLTRHIDLYIDTFGEDQTSREIRKHLLWYFRGTEGEKVLRRLLAKIEKRSDILEALDAACQSLVDAYEQGERRSVAV